MPGGRSIQQNKIETAIWTCENGETTILHATAYDVCERCFVRNVCGIDLPQPTPTCKIKVSKFFQKNISFSKKMKIFFEVILSTDRLRRRKQRRDDDDEAEKTQRLVRTRSKTVQKRFENRSKTFRKLYVFGWAHCFGLF